jgi:O-antigen/teichoic acid export membrane protein
MATKPSLATPEANPPDEAGELLGVDDDRFAAVGQRGLRAHTAQGAIITSTFNIGYATLGMVQRVAVAAYLTASEFGFWGLIVTALMTITWLKQVGVSDKYVQQDESDQEAAFQRAFTLELVYTLAFTVVIAIAIPLYGLVYGRSSIIFPAFVLSLGLLVSPLQSPIWIAYRQMRYLRQRVLEAINPVVTAAATVALVVAGAGYWGLIIGNLAGTFAAAIVAVASSPYKLRLRFDRRTARDYFSFSWPLFLSNASSLVVVQGAIVVGNYAVGLAGLGALALASSFSAFIDRVDGIVRITIYPAVCAVKDRIDVLYEAFVKSNRLALMWAVPFGVGLALFAPDLVDFILGSKWDVATGLLQAFGLILATRQIAFNWVIFMSAIGNTRPMAINGVLQIAVFLIVTTPLMLTLGLTGYVIGMATTTVLEIALRGWFLSRLFVGFNLISHIVRAVAPIAVPAALVLGLRQLESGARTPGMAAAELVLYLVASAVATLLFERRFIVELVGYLRGAVRPAAT